jgi:hypothetical protein
MMTLYSRDNPENLALTEEKGIVESERRRQILNKRKESEQTDEDLPPDRPGNLATSITREQELQN